MITCTNCGTPNTPDSRFCKQCSHSLQPPPIVSDFGARALDHPAVFTTPQKNNTQDMGYFLIAVIMVAHTILWRVGVLFQTVLQDSMMTFYKVMSVVSFFLVVGQCVIMLAYTKKSGYRVFVVIALIIEVLSSLYLIYQNVAR